MAVRALLVGIDAYTAVQPLRGCVNDMNRIEDLLRARVTGTPLHVEKLLDEQATYAGIVEAFRRHLGAGGPGDVAFFAYAGHGSQEPAPRELHVIEPDKRNETLVCVDSRTAGTFDLADKELAALIAEVVENGASVVCLFDCCHSGTITRGDVERAGTTPEPGERRALAVEAVRPFDSYLPELRERLAATRDADVAGAWAAATAHVALAACQSEETAKEVSVGNTTRGAFSVAFEQALAVEGPDASVRRLARTARARVQQLAVAQHPVVYATVDADLDRPFLGEGAGAGDRSLRLFHHDDAWEVDGGALHGLVAPSGGRAARLAVVEPGQQARLGEVEVVEVHSTRAVVRPLGGLTLDRSRQYRASIVAVPTPTLAVDVVGAGALAQAALAAIASSPLLGTGSTGQRVTVRLADDRYRVEAADGGTIVEVDPPDASRLVGLLEHLARWHGVLALDNPSSPFVGLVDLEWVSVEPGETTLDPARPAVQPPERDGGVTIDYLGSPGAWRPATWFLRIVNRTDRPVYAMLLDLTDAYRIHDALYPASSERIPAGGSAAVYGGQPIPFTISGRTLESGAVGRDWLKLVVSDVPMDSSLVVLPRLGADEGQRGGSRGAGGSDDLFGGTRDIGDDTAPASGPQWGALTIPVVIRVP